MNWRIVCVMPINYHGGRTFKVHIRAIDPATINFETHVIDEVIAFPNKQNEKRYKLNRESSRGVVKSFEVTESNHMLITFENNSSLLIK